MARQFSCAFGLNSTSNGMELYQDTSVGTISSTVYKGGLFSYRNSSMTSGQKKILQHILSQNVYFVRFHFRVATAPSAENRFFALEASAYLTLDNSRILRLYDEDGAIGDPSPAFSANTWVTIEVQYDVSGAAGSHIVRAKLNGNEFAGASDRSIAGAVGAVKFGGNINSEAQTTGDWYFTNIAINDNTDSYQNSYPGESEILYLRPVTTGDSASWSRGGSDSGANWNQVEETTPNDVTDFNGSNTLDQEDSFSVQDITAYLPPTTLINCLQVGVRFAGAAASNNASFKPSIKLTSGGTQTLGTQLNQPDAFWSTNSNTTTKNYPLTLYVHPDTGLPLYAKDLRDVEIGYKLTATSTNQTRVSGIWLIVDYSRVYEAKGKHANLRPSIFTPGRAR